MNKDDIKKALEFCADSDFKTACRNCPYFINLRCNDMLCKDAVNLIIEQENEIEYRKKQHDNQVSENTRLYIEYDKLKDDYAKLQELFAQYQMASDKEIKAQVKQAKIDVLNELKEKRTTVFIDIDEVDKMKYVYLIVYGYDGGYGSGTTEISYKINSKENLDKVTQMLKEKLNKDNVAILNFQLIKEVKE